MDRIKISKGEAHLAEPRRGGTRDMKSPSISIGMARLLPSRSNAQRLVAITALFVTLVTPPANARSVLDKLDDAVAAMANYRSGDSPEPLELVYSLTVKAQGSDAARRALSARLAGLLQSSATIEAKIFACKQLHLIGGDESVPVLARALANPELAEVALYALDGIRTPAADRALRTALQTSPAKLTVSVLHSLAERRDAFSVNTLAGLVYKRDEAIATAAIQALGSIGNDQAAHAISRARVGAPEPRKQQLTEALLVSADRLQAAGNTEAAKRFYQQLYGATQSPSVKVTAFRGLATTLGNYAAPVITDALASGSYELAATACDFVANAPANSADTTAYTTLLPTLDPNVQPLLLDALAQRGDNSAAAAVRSQTSAPQPEVRQAALRALADLGDASDVALLHDATAAEETAEVAAETLVRLSGPGVADAIARAASTGTVERRLPLIEALGARAEPDTVAGLLRFAHDADPRIRVAALNACASAAGPNDIPEIAALLLNESNAEARTATERALAALSKDAPEYAAGELASLIPQAKRDENQYASLLRVLATTEHPMALDALTGAAKSRDDAIQMTAVQALANWPTIEPIAVLERLAKGSKNDPVRAEAFRGYIQLLRLPSGRSPKQTVKLYTKAKKSAETTDDKKLLLAGLAEVPGQEALKLAEKFARDKDVQDEAALAIQRIEKTAYRAIASHAAADAEKAFDSNKRSRWATHTSQQPGQWFQLDLGWPRTISGIQLDSANSANDYPRGYELYLSSNGEDWGKPVAEGWGDSGVTTITFKPKKTRYVRIVQTGKAENYFWSIHEITAIQ